MIVRACASDSMPRERSHRVPVADAPPRADDPAEVGREDRVAGRAQVALHRRAEVARPDRRPVGVADAAPQGEHVGAPVLARPGRPRGQPADERRPGDAGDAPVGDEPVVREPCQHPRAREVALLVEPVRRGHPGERQVHAERAAPVRRLGRDRGGPHRALRDRERRRAAPGLAPRDHTRPVGVDRGPRCRPRRRPPTPLPRRPPPRPGRGRPRPDHVTAFRSGSTRASVPSVRSATHTAPSPTASALGAWPTGIASTMSPAARVDAGDVARLLARHPQRAGAGGDRARLHAEGDLAHAVQVAEVDAVDVAFGGGDHPQRALGERQRARRVGGRDPLAHLVRAGIDLRDLARVTVRHPQRARAERERGRARRRRRSW